MKSVLTATPGKRIRKPEMLDRLKILLSNKHTTGAAVVYGLCAIGQVWFPEHADKFHKTGQIALGYGLLLAGDAKPSIPPEPKTETKEKT